MATVVSSGTSSDNDYINPLIAGGDIWSGTITWGIHEDVIFWSAKEKEALRSALETFSAVADISFEEVSDASEANWRFYGYNGDDEPGSAESPFDHDDNQIDIAVNYSAPGYEWGLPDGGLNQGGLGYYGVLQLIGFALGLAAPYDDIGGSPQMPGVDLGDTQDEGTFGLNRDVVTVMSLRYGDETKDIDGGSGEDNYGFVGTPAGFDVAALQLLYGANTTTNAGDTVYELKDEMAAGSFFSTIWDTGGIDTIVYNGSEDVDLYTRKAEAPFNTGPSMIEGVSGFQIAAGVVIENLSSGSGRDGLYSGDTAGDPVINLFKGNGGNDQLSTRHGSDMLFGGGGNDELLVAMVPMPCGAAAARTRLVTCVSASSATRSTISTAGTTRCNSTVVLSATVTGARLPLPASPSRPGRRPPPARARRSSGTARAAASSMTPTAPMPAARLFSPR